jgi:hypothetical protein
MSVDFLFSPQDKYKRALADSENMRRRLMKQIDDAKLFGIQGFCKDLLEVRFEVFMAVTMKNGIFWDFTSCGSCKNHICISSRLVSVASYS